MEIFKKNKLFFFACVALLTVFTINYLFRTYPELYENLYLKGIFRVIRYLYDYLIGIWMPIPMAVISVIFIFYWIFIQKREHKNLFSLLKQLVSHFILVFCMFYVFWGWNYTQRGIANRLQIDQQIKIDSTGLYQEAEWALNMINTLRIEIQDDTLLLEKPVYKKAYLENDVRKHLSITLGKMNFPVWGKPRIRVVKPKGILMRFKTAGIYFPYAFEGHIDAALMHYEWPFTMSHEMSHAYGITDEGECNFTAFIACMESNDPYFQYSAMIDYYLYVLRDVYRMNPSKYNSIYKKLHKGVFVDIQEMRKNNEKYPDILPKVRDFMYDSYLKSNGVSAGLKSYSQLVGLVMQYKDMYGLELSQ